MDDKIFNSLNHIRNEIAFAASSVGREAKEVLLIGVSKTRSPEEVAAAFRAGLTDFGENRVQEAIEKIPLVDDLIAPDSTAIRWHLIGHLQSNKVNRAVEIFDAIHSIDSVDLAKKVSSAAARVGRSIQCCVQVNASGEDSKSGVSFENAIEIAEAINKLPALKLIGLMTIGPLTDDRNAIQKCFEDLRNLRDRISRSHPDWQPLGLSMGMSGDFDLAIACGATMVRIGTALFGAR